MPKEGSNLVLIKINIEILKRYFAVGIRFPKIPDAYSDL